MMIANKQSLLQESWISHYDSNRHHTCDRENTLPSCSLSIAVISTSSLAASIWLTLKIGMSGTL